MKSSQTTGRNMIELNKLLVLPAICLLLFTLSNTNGETDGDTVDVNRYACSHLSIQRFFSAIPVEGSKSWGDVRDGQIEECIKCCARRLRDYEGEEGTCYCAGELTDPVPWPYILLFPFGRISASRADDKSEPMTCEQHENWDALERAPEGSAKNLCHFCCSDKKFKQSLLSTTGCYCRDQNSPDPYDM